MKVLFSILSACLLLAAVNAKDAKPVAAVSSDRLFAALFNAAGVGSNMKANTVVGDVACYVEYKNEDIGILKKTAEEVLQCMEMSVEEMQRLYSSQAGSMALSKFQQAMSQCTSADASADREAKFDCYGNAIVDFYKLIHAVNKPFLWQTKLCVRYQLHEMDKRVYMAFKEMNKCMWRTMNQGQQQQQEGSGHPQQQQSPSGSQQQQQ